MLKRLLPKWTEKRNIHIFAGIEHVAKRESGVWYVKKKRCNLCGKCCMDVPVDWPHGYNHETKNCIHLVKSNDTEYLCNSKGDRNFSCCYSEGEPEFCNITWQKIE
jgi:hypothetical protein